MKRASFCFAVALSACASSAGEVANPDAALALDTIDDSSTFAPGQCRWEGYGIGAPPDMQCDQVHLFAHSVEACLAVGGTLDGAIVTRDVAGTCTSGPQEVQVFCCFRGRLPTAEDVPASPLVARDRHVSSGSAAASRDDLFALAQTDCLDAKVSLEDWSVVYGPDGVSAQFMWFNCR